MVKEPTAGHDEQRSGGLHSTSEPRQHADQDLPPNHRQHSRNSWPATRARESGSHAGSIKKRAEKYRESKQWTLQMIAAWNTRAGKDRAPRVLKFRISRHHGAESARCAVPRLSAPGWASQSERSLSARLPRRRCPSLVGPQRHGPPPGRARARFLSAPVAPAPPWRSSHPRPGHSLCRRRILRAASARRRGRHSRRAGRATRSAPNAVAHSKGRRH